MQTIALSEIRRCRASPPRQGPGVSRSRIAGRDAYRELVEAGIMEPDGEDFRFTEEGWARREELIGAAEAHLRSLEPRLPERIELSRAAREDVGPAPGGRQGSHRRQPRSLPRTRTGGDHGVGGHVHQG